MPNETPYGVHNKMSDKMPNNILGAAMCNLLIDELKSFGDRVELLQPKKHVRRIETVG